MDEKSIVKLNPTNDLTILLDKTFRNIFNPRMKNSERRIIEDKKAKIKTIVKLECFKGNLNQFDKFIFCAAVSEYRAGNEIFSIRRIFQHLGGGHFLTNEMREMISASVEKLACTRAEINMTAINEKFHYCDKAEVIFRNYLLPCKAVEVKIGGQITQGAYRILDDSPLFQVAELKKQFTTQPIALLDVPKLHNSELVLKLKFFLLERITAIIGSHKKHKAHISGKKKDGGFIYKRATKLQKIITFEDIFEQCELSDATKRQQQQARETITHILEHFKTEKLISEWHFEKKNGRFHAVIFDCQPC